MTMASALERIAVLGTCAAVPATLCLWKRSAAKASGMPPDGRRATGTDPGETEASDGAVSMFDKLSRMFGAGGVPAIAAPPPAAPTSAPMDFEDERIPDAARVKIRRILACVEEIEKAMSREQVPGFGRIDMEHLRDIHLPKLARSYVDIPAGYRSEIFRKTGKSASFILLESLDQMQVKIDEILKNLAQSDLDAFTENAQFIGNRYGDADNPFN